MTQLRKDQREQRKKIKEHEEKKSEYMTLSKSTKDLEIEINVK